MHHSFLPSIFASMLFLSVTQAAPMPSVDEPLPTGIQTPEDAAVVIGVENYPKLGPGFKVDYAEEDALAFNNFLLYTRGLPDAQVNYLNPLSGKEEITKAFKKAAGQATGTLWFYFAGHGAADPKTKEQILLPGDLPDDSELQPMRMLPISDLQKIARDSKAKNVIFVIDACHAQLESTRFVAPVALASPSPKDHMVLWTAAKVGQLSKAMPSTSHGAFTYAVLRALRGDADGEVSGKKDGIIDLDEADRFVNQFLKTQKIYQSQTPQLNRPAKLSFELSKVETTSATSADQKKDLSPEEMYQKGVEFEKQKNGPKAAEWYLKAAEKGHAKAQNAIGLFYELMSELGRQAGFPYSPKKAAEWYRKAAEQGLADAQFNLGFLYRQGQGVEHSYDKAIEWMSKAGYQGHLQACRVLGEMFNEGDEQSDIYPDDRQAVEWFLKAANQGDAWAQYSLGRIYLIGGYGVKKDREEARKWFKRSADQGEQEAAEFLHDMEEEDKRAK